MSPETDLPLGSVEMRRRVLALVERYPGLHLREIQRRAQTSAMLAEYHLNILEKMGLVTSHEEKGYRNFFPVHQAPLQLDATDKRWLALMRRPVVLGMVLSLLETGPSRPLELARVASLPASTALYQIKTMRNAGLLVQGDERGPTYVRLADPNRVLELLRAYHPLPDALSEFASMWSRAIETFQQPAPQPPPASLPALPTDLPAQVAEASESVQAVYAALATGPLTVKDLCLETGLARRTVYTALVALRSMGHLQERPHLADMRQTRFSLRRPPPT